MKKKNYYNVMKKKLFLILGVFYLFSLSIFAQSGKTGNLTWSIKDGTLTIKGTGEMPNYTQEFTNPLPSTPWISYRSSFDKLIIEDGITSIGSYAFKFCKITTVSLPNSLMIIGYEAFRGCTDLIAITLPNSLTNIYGSAFESCYKLASLSIPSSVKGIAGGAFEACDNISAIYVNSNNPNYTSLDGVLFSKDQTVLVQYPSGKGTTYSIPNGTIVIDDMAFRRSNLTSVKIPQTVNTINYYAFSLCENLTSIEIPNGVKEIGDYVFHYCKNLTSVKIPNSLESIGFSNFYGCVSLKNVYVNWMNPLDVSKDKIFMSLDLTEAVLHVPYGTKSLYRATDIWRDFGTIVEMEMIAIVIEEPDPIGEDGKGSIDFSLEIPADATITGTFEIKLPEGYTLDESATKLIEALAGHFDLIITFKGSNVWQIEIKSKGLRAATAVALTKIMNIAYTVDPATPKGKYDIEISHIELDLSDGTSINDETITVTTEVIYSTTGIDDLQAAPQIWSAGGQVHILLPEATNVQVVNLVGVTVYKAQLSAGAHSVALSKGVYIVRAGSAVRKLRMEN